ncbi:LacI family DNA-binding transcriptional regulator [Albidovulum sp.]
MARRKTISDVARAAGVSVATVDRVLNGRERVREATARKVYEAASRIGYHASGLIAQRLAAQMPAMRFGFIMQKERQAFYQDFAAAARRAVAAAEGIRGEAIVEFATSQAPAEFAALMRGMIGRADAVAATAVAHHEVTAAVEDLKAAGIPCFSLLNDFAQGVRQHYIGLNNLKVGRIAASIITMAVHRPGKIAVFVGGHRWHGHDLRETGFRSFFREYAPQFQVLDTLVNLETRQLTYEATLDLLGRHGDLRGIYSAGGGMEGAIAALRESREPGEVALVVNEITPESRAALADRYLTMVIQTPLDEVCRDAVSFMIAAAQGKLADVTGQQFLQPRLYIPESV